MEELISFDSLFEPVKANPVNADRLFGWDSQGNVNAAFTILGLKTAFGGGNWNTMANKPPSFTPSAHSLGSHSNVAAGVDGAADGTIMKKVAGVWTAVIPNYADTGEIPDVPSWVLNITETQKSNWDEAYGWGDHAAAGYITGFTETDPVFSASPAAGITALEKANWNTAFGWGNHAAVGYLTAFVETDPVFQASAASGISIGNIGVWDAKAMEFAGLSDNSLLLLSNGVPTESGILAAFTPNPYDPVTEEEDYDAFVPTLLNFTFPVIVKGVDGVDADDFATMGQLISEPSTGSEILFDRLRTYGTEVSPITDATITEVNDALSKPVIQLIIHQAASFNPPATWAKSTGSDDYIPASINWIYVEHITSTKKRYTIDHDE